MAGKSSRRAAPRAGTKAPKASARASRSSSGRAGRQSPAHEKLASELVGMLPEIDAEGLLYLVRQASVLLHNKRVDELNAEMERQNRGTKKAQRRAGTTARVGQTVEEITVEIQRSPDGKTYYMIVDGQKHFLTAQEMAAVAKLCFRPERKSDALRFLSQYMTAERKEILDDHNVSSERHPFFEALFYEVRSKFSLDT